MSLIYVAPLEPPVDPIRMSGQSGGPLWSWA